MEHPYSSPNKEMTEKKNEPQLRNNPIERSNPKLLYEDIAFKIQYEIWKGIFRQAILLVLPANPHS